jgi:hypothetical protein
MGRFNTCLSSNSSIHLFIYSFILKIPCFKMEYPTRFFLHLVHKTFSSLGFLFLFEIFNIFPYNIPK